MNIDFLYNAFVFVIAVATAVVSWKFFMWYRKMGLAVATALWHDTHRKGERLIPPYYYVLAFLFWWVIVFFENPRSIKGEDVRHYNPLWWASAIWVLKVLRPNVARRTIRDLIAEVLEEDPSMDMDDLMDYKTFEKRMDKKLGIKRNSKGNITNMGDFL